MILTLSNADRDDVGTLTRRLLALAGLVCTVVAVVAGWAPALALPWPLPPLHAGCLAAMQLATSLPWLMAWRECDSAAVRIPLAQMLASGALTVLLVLLLRGSELPALRPAAAAWVTVQALLAAGAGAWWLARRSEVRAPAERPDQALRVAGAAFGGAALLLAVNPGLAARAWPWPLGAEAAVLYAASLGGFAVALLMLASERRRSARRLALWGLVMLGCGVALVSWRESGAFHRPLVGWAWVVCFAVPAALAARRLARPWPVRPLERARPSDRQA
jgi:hypothetical protein